MKISINFAKHSFINFNKVLTTNRYFPRNRAFSERKKVVSLPFKTYCGVEQLVARQAHAMDTKLKADIAESAVVTELLKRGYNVLRPVGDRLPYDLAIDLTGKLLRIQVKSAWYDPSDKVFCVDSRRTKTNRRHMVRSRYDATDFDFAILYIEELHVFYIMPVAVFTGFNSTISLIEESKRQRKPASAEYRERWDLISKWAPQSEMIGRASVKFGGAYPENLNGLVVRKSFTGSNTEPISGAFSEKV